MQERTLVGAWSLVSYTIRNQEGVQVSEPFGSSPRGMLIYTENGFMSAHTMPASRSLCRSNNELEASSEEKALAFDTYYGYCGTYELQKDRVIHHVMTSFFPNWVNTDLVRVVKLDGDLLTLTIVPSEMVNGELLTEQLTWRRL